MSFGFLNINKPASVTSRDVVNRVQRIVRPDKAGHAGTLDPLATGVLVVAVGPATRLVERVQRMPKRYQGVFLLGKSSDTEDVEGQIVELDDPPSPSLEQIESALPQFLGDIMQRPPAYSALKVKGRRAYQMARKGEDVKLEPRPVHIGHIRVVEYEYPRLTLDIGCGSGTYIRSLGRDLAKAVGTEAVMAELERTEIGPFLVGEAFRLDAIHEDSLDASLLSPALAVADLPKISCDAQLAKRVAQGLPIQAPQGDIAELAAVSEEGHLLAILTRRQDGSLRPSRNFIRPA